MRVAWEVTAIAVFPENPAALHISYLPVPEMPEAADHLITFGLAGVGLTGSSIVTAPGTFAD